MFPNPQNQAFRNGFGLQIGSYNHDFLWPQSGPRVQSHHHFWPFQVAKWSYVAHHNVRGPSMWSWASEWARQQDTDIFGLTIGGLTYTRWWFQPSWKISVKLGSSSPICGVKIKNIWKQHLVHFKIHNYKNTIRFPGWWKMVSQCDTYITYDSTCTLVSFWI